MEATPEALAELLREEETIQFSVFDNQAAWRVGSRLVALATERALPITIDIRRNGQQLFHCALPGTSADNDAWIERKIRVVNRYGHSSLYIGMRYRAQGTTFEEKSLLNPRKYAAHGGAFPISIARVGVVGVVTVSGLAQEDDHRLVVEVLREFAEPGQTTASA